MTLLSMLGAGAGVIAVLVAGTFLLPRHVTVQRSASLAADASKVIALAASNEGYQRFNPYKNMDPNLSVTMFGPTSGVGSGFAFKSKDGEGKQVVTAVSATAVSYDIDLGAMGKPKSSISVAPDGAKTRVTWRTDMDMGMNPIGRVIGLFMDRMLGGTYETGLKKLETAAQSEF